AQRALLRTPSSHGEAATSGREAVLALFRQVAREGRRMLTEPEAKAAISAYGIPVPETIIARSPAKVGQAAGRLLKTSEQVVVKLLSEAISHKSDVGGAVLGIAAA
ncbi:GNAT family N-acetyltransferase, partial [Mesorhizobium sp. M2D.F.Ca.ET.145.01.1.1]